MSYKLGIHISCPIPESATAISHELFNFANCHWTATTSKHSSCCHDFYNYDWLLIFQPAFTNHFPLVVHPANSPYLTSSIHTATTSKHNSCCNNFYNYDWLLIVQPANTTAFTIYVAFPTTISSLLLNTQIQHLAQHPPQFVLHFPLK